MIALISLGNNTWSFNAGGTPVTISATNPVPVTLTIGQNTGTTKAYGDHSLAAKSNVRPGAGRDSSFQLGVSLGCLRRSPGWFSPTIMLPPERSSCEYRIHLNRVTG